MYQVSSFFIEVSAYISLSLTVVKNILNTWILDSVSKDLNLLHIHLLPELVYFIEYYFSKLDSRLRGNDGLKEQRSKYPSSKQSV